jgi:hypothetical protein
MENIALRRYSLATTPTQKKIKIIALRSLHILYMFVLRADIVTIFEPKMVTISARNTNIYKICKRCNLQDYIFQALQHFANFAILLISLCSF